MKVELRGKGPVYDAIRDCYPFVSVGDIRVCAGDSHIYTAGELAVKPIINVHTSLLPKYRGRHPVDWAMENREKEIGITIHYMSPGIDEGDIILQDSVLYKGEGYDAVMAKVCALVPDMVRTALKQIECGCAYRRRQHGELATYYPKRTKPRIFEAQG